MSLKHIEVNIPKHLYEDSKQLVDAQIFSSIEEIICEGLRREMVYYFPVFYPAKDSLDSQRCAEAIEKIRDRMNEKDMQRLKGEKVIKRLRQTREELWREKYSAYFG
ncbi:MAG: hypothetical protein AB1422_14660 [bacterium]